MGVTRSDARFFLPKTSVQDCGFLYNLTDCFYKLSVISLFEITAYKFGWQKLYGIYGARDSVPLGSFAFLWSRLPEFYVLLRNN